MGSFGARLHVFIKFMEFLPKLYTLYVTVRKVIFADDNGYSYLTSYGRFV